jgi:hypothetical protein
MARSLLAACLAAALAAGCAAGGSERERLGDLGEELVPAGAEVVETR